MESRESMNAWNEWNKIFPISNHAKMERGTSGTRFAIRRKIIKINKI